VARGWGLGVLGPEDLHPYQKRAVTHVLEHPRSFLWLDLGLGKTAVVLTALQRLMAEMKVYRALVLAPKRVAETVWRQEIEQWSHLQGMKALLLRGSKAEKMHALCDPNCQIHIANYEGTPWLVNAVNSQFLSKGKFPPWNFVAYDEVDRLKDSQGVRFQLLQKLVGIQPGGGTYFPFRTGLTGTPADNGLIDLHGQALAIDDGERLYPDIGTFRAVWCKAGYAERTWEVRPEAKAVIESRIQDITLSMNADDYLSLPDYVETDHWVDLPPAIQAGYDELETEMFAQLERHEEDPLDGEYDLEVHSAMTVRAKLRQIANGCFLVPENTGETVIVHSEKLEVLDSILHEAAGKPVLLAYQFRHDMERIRARYTKQGYRVAYIGPGTKDVEAVVNAWNSQRYHLLVSHPLSIGHGLNLQMGGNEVCWFGLTDNLRLYRQMNARLRRQGQSAPNVHIRRILARGTVDEALSALLKRKTATAEDLRIAIEAYQRTKQSSTWFGAPTSLGRTHEWWQP